jgi:putative ABC transport system permease protein
MLGIIIGIAAVIVGVSMGAGAKAEVDKQIASMGNNLLIIFSGNMSRRRAAVSVAAQLKTRLRGPPARISGVTG